MHKKNIINDVTTLNPTKIRGTLYPESVEEIQDIVKRYDNISIGGGHFSMGGQTAEENSIHVDMREYNKIVSLDVSNREITVNAGITWKEIQEVIDEHGLAISIMQTYSNFTVGGSLCVNVHGRYIGAGPLAISIKKFQFINASGELKEADKEHNQEYFEMFVGGYGSIGVVTDITLSLAQNKHVKQISKKMSIKEYLATLNTITKDKKSVFHNADIYPPHYTSVNSVTWRETEEPLTETKSIQKVKKFYPLEMYALWAISSTPLGTFRREHLYDKLIFAKPRVYQRNYEASYDVAELEPFSRKNSTYVLQEYFIPIENAEAFIEKLAKVFVEYGANILNISIRHSVENQDSLLSWSRGEVLAFVVYYKQGTSKKEQYAVSVWTRKAITAAIEEKGAYYLPYQPHATYEQLLAAYPNFETFARKKRALDPTYKFRNSLFDKYIYNDKQITVTNFYEIVKKDLYKDKMYDFLLHVFRTEEKKVFYTLIEAIKKLDTEEKIYKQIQEHCRISAKTVLNPSSVIKIIKQIFKQNRVIKEQTKELIDTPIKDFLFVEPTDMTKPTKLYHAQDRLDLSNILGLKPKKATQEFYIQKGKSIVDTLQEIADDSLDIVSVYGGLHHIPKQVRVQAHKEIFRILRDKGKLILREHDVKDADMFAFVSLIHAVFNAVTAESLESELAEVREFESIDTIVSDIEKAGLKDSGDRLRQYGDPSDNILLCFVKTDDEK